MNKITKRTVVWLDAALRSARKTFPSRALFGAALAIALADSAGLAGAAETSLPAYQPEQQAAGTIRTWGHGSLQKDYIGSLVRSWEAGFRKFQPGVSFVDKLRGNGSAIGGLYTGAADIALMDRGIWAMELDGYQQVFNRDPVEISVATGSLDVREHAPALVVFVNNDNPLKQLTLTQLDAIFGSDHLRGPRNVYTWGDLGLTGEWADKPIDVYVYGITLEPSQFFMKTVMGASQKWTGRLKEFWDKPASAGARGEAGQQIVDALAKNRYAIGISTFLYSNSQVRNSQVRPLSIASNDGGPYFAPTRENVATRDYPLTRTVSAFINRATGQPVDPKVKEYLRYILSKEGQQDIARDGGYLPLSPALAGNERAKLQ